MQKITVRIFSIAHVPNFIEMMQALALSFNELGCDASWGEYQGMDDTKFGDVNIVITAHRSFDPVYRLPQSSTNILFQTEELWNRRQIGVYDKSKGWDWVLELFEDNCAIPVGTERVRYCPLGWSPAFEGKWVGMKTLNGYFFGSMTDRRKQFQAGLEKRFSDIRIVEQEWRQERDCNIVGSRINLSFKANDVWGFPPLRALLVLCKDKFFLCEATDGSYGPYQPGVHFITFDTEDDLYAKFEYFLDRPNMRKEFAQNALEDLKKNCVLTANLETAMQGIIC